MAKRKTSAEAIEGAELMTPEAVENLKTALAASPGGWHSEPESPYVLVEAPDGSGAYRVDVPAEVGKERVLNVGGVSYEHCADGADGRWIYRMSR